jgi:hypothetical protein
VLGITPVATETFYRIEPEAGGTRVTMTFRCHLTTLTPGQQKQLTGEVSDTVNRYKALIEEAGGQA